MTLDDLCDALDAAGAELNVTGDRLVIAAPRGALTPALRQALTKHRPALIEALAVFRPLDEVIADSEASRRTLADIEVRLERLTAIAAQPGASSLNRQLIEDWTKILAAKVRQESAA